MEWLTTTPHPLRAMRAHTHSADDGQTGWRVHLVEEGKNVRKHWSVREETDRDFSPALCGLIPKHGWGLDMFINEPCKRCLARAEKLALELPELPK